MQEVGLIPGSGRSPEVQHGNSLQYSCLDNPMDRRAQCTTVHGVTKSWTLLKQLGMHTCMHACVCVCVCIYEYYLAIKNNTIMSFEVTWIGPEIIILSEVSQRKTDII